MSRQADLEAAVAARRVFWSQVGALDQGVLAPLVSAHLVSDAPAWPHAREAFAIVHRKDSVIIATDGLSNPPDPDDPSERLGFEMFIEIADPDAIGLSMAEVSCRPEFDVLQQIVFNVIRAGRARLLASLEAHGVMSWEVSAGEERGPFVGLGVHGNAFGLLVGLTHGDVPLAIPQPDGSARLIPVTMIHGRELEYLVERGPEARRELADALLAAGHGWRTDMRRGPLLGG
jgi:hypothetical protein